MLCGEGVERIEEERLGEGKLNELTAHDVHTWRGERYVGAEGEGCGCLGRVPPHEFHVHVVKGRRWLE